LKLSAVAKVEGSVAFMPSYRTGRIQVHVNYGVVKHLCDNSESLERATLSGQLLKIVAPGFV